MVRSTLRQPAVLGAALVLMLASGTLAHAAVTRLSGPTTIFGEGRALVKFDAAYDSIHRVYLVVYGTQALGPVNGILLNENGAALTGLFALSDGAQQSGWARVIFSAEEGKFLVSYVRVMGNGRHQKAARFVSVISNAPSLGPEMVLDDWVSNAGTATGMAYSAGSGKFLVTWSHYAGPFPLSFVSVIDPSGAFTAPKVISDPADAESDPEIACDPVARKCLVVGITWGLLDGSGKSNFWARFIADSTGDPVTGVTYVMRVGGLMDPPAVAFSPASGGLPGQFLIGMGFGGVIKGTVAQGPSGSFGAPFNMIQDTTPLGSDGVGYGFVSMRYNAGSGTTIATMTTWTGNGAVQELDGAGARVPKGFDLIPSTPEIPSKPWDTANQFTVAATNSNTAGFLALEDHFFKAIKVSVYSGASALAPPAVTQHPSALNAWAGDPVSFTAAASGGPAPGVQWQVKVPGDNEFRNIPGANFPTLSFVARRADSGKLYRALFSNGFAPNALTVAVTLNVFGVTSNDMDGDGISDPLVWRASSGTWLSTSSATGAPSAVQWGNTQLGDVPLSGDIDGDGGIDLVVWRPSDGTWYWLTSSTGYDKTIVGQQKQWGNDFLGDVPMLADMDGDGRSDLVLWRASTGTWFWLTSSSGYAYGSLGTKQWGSGIWNDVPLAADFDGDGKADLAIWRPANGMWQWLTSSSGYDYAANRSRQWGNALLGDRPFIGNFDGDRRADLAIWRASTGTWFWLNSSASYSYAPGAVGIVQWGNETWDDRPALMDFDGDGRSDLTVWRPASGMWFWLTSSSGWRSAGARQFGAAGDIPLVK